MQNQQSITIDNITVKTDSEGRFCLNDLHKASGGNSNHQPAFFFRNEHTVQLVDELLKSANTQSFSPVHKVTGRIGGT